MKRESFYLWLFIGLPIVYYLSLPISVGDLAVWVAHGKYFLLHNQFLRRDIFSVLPTKDLVYPEVICIIYASIFSIGGLTAVSLFHKLALLLLALIWERSSLSKIKSPWSYLGLFIICFSWFGSSMFWVDRPALIGMIPLVVSYLILQKNEELTLKDLVYLTLINIGWVNLHGSWILLNMMYLWREVGRAIFYHQRLKWQVLFSSFIFFVSSLINPFGYKVFSYIFETAALSKLRRIDEWDPPSLFGAYPSQAGAYFLLLFLIFIFALFLFQKDRIKFKRVLASPFFLLLLLGAHSIRNTALAFFVLVPFACEFILEKGDRKEVDQKKAFINLAFIGLVLVCGVAFLPMVKPYAKNFLPENKRDVYDNSAPFKFAKILNGTLDTDPVFNDWEYGSYLILAQKHQIFIDTRNIIYSNEGFREYLVVVNAEPGWDSILQKYKIKYVLLNRKLRKSLTEKLKTSVGWTILMEQDETVLFVRKN